MRLLLLRHGQTHGNTSGALDTAFPGLDLTDLGERQAEAAARVLESTGLDGIYVSPLVRTQQTAAPLATLTGIAPVILEGLREIAAADYEMATDEESILGYIGTVADWIEGRFDTRMSGGEDGHEFLARYDGAIAEILTSGHKAALVVSHGAAIRTWLSARATDAATHAMATEGLANTALIELEGDFASGWSILSWTSEPIGGSFLSDEAAPDPTGHGTDEVLDEP
ncbi:histidine phosphatase family protein [Nocardioides marmorisolisilvae]|uniref:Histidine phosphatase family protein n=1 Tax=Nocardioides marmorisolisilvae TaxID=1542737 RepID=A0A3N0DPB3_9ACTN|nr:histidine phosphatase family protein [Nocardioides marmorisolisilvae]RNL77482.1 histidine phosphatase family protein [Nocardioides marmorisolisilvae]